jgi:TolB-like protein/Flp pilus assembly protein TadD
MSPDPNAEYFSDGITEEIINALMKIDALRVAARTSSFAFMGKAEDVRGIGERLGVRTVLEGSVRQAGGKLRVTAQLINVADGYQLWSERYDRSLEDVFAVQDEISRAIASTLEVRLLGPEAAFTPRATPDHEAYELFLKGRWFFNQRSASKAVMEFDAAIAKDSSFAPAYTGLADSYGIHAFYGGIDTRVAYAKARAAAEKARAIAPDSSEVHLSLGILEHYFGWDFEREKRELRLAIARNPRWGAPYYWLGLIHDLRGQIEEGIPLARRAAELEPLSPVAVAAPGWGFYLAGRTDEALREFRKGLEIDPNGVYPLFCVGMASQCMGAHADALASFEKLVTVTGGGQSHSLGLLGGAYAAAGRNDEAGRILEGLRERSAREYVAPLHRAFVEVPLGDHDAAFESLTRACEERNALAWWWVAYDPGFAALRGDARFSALRARVVPG